MSKNKKKKTKHVKKHYNRVVNDRVVMGKEFNYFYKRVYNYALNLLKPFDEKENIIDIGSSFGSITKMLLDCKGVNKKNLYISDISPEMLKKSDLPKKRKYLDDIQESKIPSNKFDKLICIAVVPHLEDELAGLKNMHRVLKKGGIGVITFTNKFSFANMFHYLNLDYYSRKNLKAPVDKRHSYWESKKLLEKAGFEILEVDQDWFLPPSIPFRLKSGKILDFGHFLGKIFLPFTNTYYLKVKKK